MLSQQLSVSAKHFTRHAVEVIKRKKKRRSAPLITAPSTLVAGNVTPSKMIDVKIVPRMPRSIKERGVPIQSRPLQPQSVVLANSVTAR